MNNETLMPHSVLLDNRSRMELDGILDVDSFTDVSIIANSTLGNIAIDGSDLKVDSFSSQTGKLVVKGNVDSFCYFGNSKGKKRLLSRGDRK